MKVLTVAVVPLAPPLVSGVGEEGGEVGVGDDQTPAGVVTCTLDSGTTVSVPGNTVAGPDDNGLTIDGVPLLDDLTTISAPLNGSGSELAVFFEGFFNDNNSGLVIDKLVIEGRLVPEPASLIFDLATAPMPFRTLRSA